jgi:hypothetical protein
MWETTQKLRAFYDTISLRLNATNRLLDSRRNDSLKPVKHRLPLCGFGLFDQECRRVETDLALFAR